LEIALTKFEQNLRVYETFRNYARHEDNLINNRVMWLLSIHGFLYATYGLTLQKKLEIIEKISLITSKAGPPPYLTVDDIHTYMSENHLDLTLTYTSLFLFLISAVGFSISLYAFRSIRAAKKSVINLQAIFRLNFTIKQSQKDKDDPGKNIEGVANIGEAEDGKEVYVPDIAGGGRKFLSRSGHSASVTIPIILASSWFLSFIALAYISYPEILPSSKVLLRHIWLYIWSSIP
jgi:hypothetical protein